MAYGIIENGVVTNAVEATAAFAKAQGWVELTGGAGIGWTFKDGTFSPPVTPPTPQPGVNERVDAERDRRLALDMTYAGKTFQMDPASQARIDKARTSAAIAIMGGVQPGDLRWHGLPVDFFWIAANDTRMPMDAQTMVAFGNAVAAREGLLIVAGNDLKLRIAAGEAITDIGSNALWPA